MGQRFAVVVGVSDPERVAGLLEALQEQKLDGEHLTSLVGPRATKTAIESRLRQFRRKFTEKDQLYLFWSGPIFTEAGQNYLITADTQDDDRIPTSVPFADLLDSVNAVASQEFCLFFDATEVGLLATEARDFLTASERGVAFLACSDEESSQTNIWMSLIADALAGRSPKARSSPNQITVASLRSHLETELPRALRAALDEPAVQTPVVVTGCRDDLVVWELNEEKGEDRPPVDLDRLKRVVLRAETNEKVKNLGGFQKTHRVPETANAWAERFVGKIAQSDIREDIDEVFDALRRELGFKRKDLEAAAEDDGVGFIRTPAFDYTVTVRVDPDDPEWVIWRREVGQIREPARIQSDAFRAVFGDVFDRLVFEFAEPLDVVAFVDRIEEAEPEGVQVRIASDGSHCEVTLDGLKGAVRIDTNTLRIEGGSPAEAGGLVGQFFEFLRRFGDAPGVGPLPLGETVD